MLFLKLTLLHAQVDIWSVGALVRRLAAGFVSSEAAAAPDSAEAFAHSCMQPSPRPSADDLLQVSVFVQGVQSPLTCITFFSRISGLHRGSSHECRCLRSSLGTNQVAPPRMPRSLHVRARKSKTFSQKQTRS